MGGLSFVQYLWCSQVLNTETAECQGQRSKSVFCPEVGISILMKKFPVPCRKSEVRLKLKDLCLRRARYLGLAAGPES